jgi:hypothetical protein
MPPTLETADGRPVEVAPPDTDAVNREFSRAMAVAGADEQAPPKRRPDPAPGPDAPRRKPGRPPKAEQARTTATATAALSDGQRAQGVKGLAQLGAGLALMFGKATGKDAYKADAVTIASSADEIADACVQTAKADAKFAAALDKVCSAGPYAALITVGVGVGSQCARNHKPALKLPGTVDPAELLKAQDEAEKTSA